ncbi:ABC transporter permease [Colwelliaceae bacterium 6441]
MNFFSGLNSYQLKQAFLSLRQKPGFVFSVVSTMGITLGALLCVLTLNYLLLVEPLPYPEQDRLFVAEHKIIGEKKEIKTVAYSYAGLVHLYKNKSTFEQSAMMVYGQAVIISQKNQPLVNTAYVTPEFHQLLASPVVMGRSFEASEALDSNNPVALLSYNTWQQEYAGSASILDQKINLNGVSYKIVGVLAKNFVEPELAEIGRETQVWLPWDFNQSDKGQRQSFTNIDSSLKFIGQLKKGVTSKQAETFLTPFVSNRWQEGVADMVFFKGWSVRMNVRSVKAVMLGESESIAVMLLVGVLGLVLIACGNISNLFMSRTVEKQRQIAIHAAIGATKKHLFKAMFAETSLLFFMSIILALVVANVGFYIMQQYLAAVLPRVNELVLNPITFASAIFFTIVLALFFAKLSTRMINYHTLSTSLQGSGKGSGLQVSKKTRQVLIASQVALAMVLVFVNVSLFKDAMKTINAPIGFSTNNLSTLILNFSPTQPSSQAEVIPIMTEIMEGLEALPQVQSVSQGSSPLDGFGIKALTKPSGTERYTPYFKRIDHRYFNIIEQELLQGENFTVVDRRDNPNAMVVNQAFAKQLKTDGDVIGMRLSSIGEPDFKIIAIVKDITIPGDTAFGSEDAVAGVPRSYAPNALHQQQFILKLKAEQSISRQQLGALVAEIDSRYSVFSFNTAADALTKRLFTDITTAVTTAALALIAFLLAGIGIYGILSYSAQIRRYEIGTRMAIGAKGKDIIYMIIKDNTTDLVIGILLSISVLLGLYISFSDKLTSYISIELLPVFIGTLALISIISFFACYLPLRSYINKPTIHNLRGSE